MLMYKLISILLLFNSAWAQEIVHIVGHHDNLMKISLKYYNTRRCWREILTRNASMKNDKDLNPGDKVVIPPPSKCYRNKVDQATQVLWNKANYIEDTFKNLKKDEISEVKTELNLKKDAQVLADNYEAEINHEKNFKASISLSPFVLKQNDDEVDITYGGYLSYLKSNKELFFEYERNIFSSTDSLTRLKIRSGSQKALMTFDINRLWGEFTYFALASYQNEREGDLFITEDRFLIGPVGIKYYFIKNNEHLKDLSLSFIPLFEYLVENASDNPTSIINDKYHKVISKNIRQSFRLRIKASFFEDRLKIKNIVFYRPALLLDKNRFDFQDALFEQVLKFSYALNDMVEFSYKNIFTWDKRASTVHKLPATDVVHRITLDFYKKF